MADEKTDEQKKIEYFEKHALPWLFAHMSMRTVGFQIFIATQGGLLVAWSASRHWSLILLGLASCLSFLLWDRRNRFIFQSIHKLGEKLVDKPLFGPVGAGTENERAAEGLHMQTVNTLSKSGKWKPTASHTWAIQVMLFAAVIAWLGIILSSATYTKSNINPSKLGVMSLPRK